MLIKIVKCSANWWYKNNLEFVYNVSITDKIAYWVIDENGSLRWVYKDDCIPWEPEDELNERLAC